MIIYLIYGVLIFTFPPTHSLLCPNPTRTSPYTPTEVDKSVLLVMTLSSVNFPFVSSSDLIASASFQGSEIHKPREYVTSNSTMNKSTYLIECANVLHHCKVSVI
jgi:hypothetical protein